MELPEKFRITYIPEVGCPVRSIRCFSTVRWGKFWNMLKSTISSLSPCYVSCNVFRLYTFLSKVEKYDKITEARSLER